MFDNLKEYTKEKGHFFVSHEKFSEMHLNLSRIHPSVYTR